MRESPGRQGTVNFLSQPNIKPYHEEEQNRTSRDSGESEPFDWVEFKSNGGGSILTGEPRKDRSPGRNQGETDTQGDRVVPIVVMGGKDRSHSREKETNPFLEEGGADTELDSKGSIPTKDFTTTGGKNGLKSIEGDRTENACYACDVCTQTEISGKKNCIVM